MQRNQSVKGTGEQQSFQFRLECGDTGDVCEVGLGLGLDKCVQHSS